MPFKLIIGHKGKAFKIESTNEFFIGKSLGDKVHGKEISPNLSEYELEITGASDIAGFPHMKGAAGIALRRVLLTKGWGMHDSRKGVRVKKTVRGEKLSEKTAQINLKVVKEGSKKLEEVFAPAEKKE